MITIDMVPFLCCPNCRAAGLRAEIKKQDNDKIIEGNLHCNGCDISYPIISAIPDLIPYNVLNNDEWLMWKDHLEGLQARRSERIEKPISMPHPSGRLGHQAFFEHAGIADGAVLDVGCGPGKLRFYLNESRVTYYGLDPIPLKDTINFYYVRALAEYIPFRDAMFSHMMVTSSLDHFQDLDAFFQESARVLKKDGKLHILQSIHGVSGFTTGVKMLIHFIKDAIDDRSTKRSNPKRPKHMREFNRTSLLEVSRKYFEIVSMKEYSQNWYSPSKLFISMLPIT